MKNRFVLFIVLAAMIFSLVLPTSSVEAAGKTATLVDFFHLPSKGYTVVFAISGDWKDADLKGNTITVDGKTYDLYCNFRDGSHISCTMSHGLSQFAGDTAYFSFGGQSFNYAVPVKIICYGYTFYTVSDEGYVYRYYVENVEEALAYINHTWPDETFVPGPGVQCYTGELDFWLSWKYIGDIYEEDYDGPPMG